MSLTPYVIFLGVAGVVALVFVSLWERIVELLSPLTAGYRRDLERAGIQVKAEELVFGIIGFAVIMWGAILLLTHPNPLIGAAELLGCGVLAFYSASVWVQGRIKKRLRLFNEQLEIALRLMSSGLRVGLGLRQALTTVVQEMPEPARIEFGRVLGQTSIGVSIYDALDQLSGRMPSNELTMMAKAIRVQSQTGGNLGHVLEVLAETIKQRRKITRKVRALTSEARASGYVITALPIFVGGFILVAEPHMRGSLFGTLIGRLSLLGTFTLIAVGQLIMNRMTDFEA